jgi:hypothetical protein
MSSCKPLYPWPHTQYVRYGKTYPVIIDPVKINRPKNTVKTLPLE